MWSLLVARTRETALVNSARGARYEQWAENNEVASLETPGYS